MLSITFPAYEPSRLAIKVKPAVERKIRQLHPWVFDEGIVKQSAEGQSGDLAVIFDQKKNRFLALGLYDPHSPIRIKLLQFGKGATIDAAWFGAKIEAAHALRAPLLATDTNSYRLLHGENDGLPGLVADVYADVLVLKLYSTIWLPYLSVLVPLLQARAAASAVVLRLSRAVSQRTDELQGLADGQVIAGTLADEVVVFREHGVLFSANVIHGHKTGYFLDHRENRRRVGSMASGKTVLDVFSYAGGFSVHALAGGATEVTSLDISAQALAMAQANARLNVADPPHEIRVGDAFEELAALRRMGASYDIVVIDPPSFAKRASERDRALHQYRQLAALGAALVSPKGWLILASCSSRVTSAVFFEAMKQELAACAPHFALQLTTEHDVDHPIGFPEGAYLKCMYWRG